MGHIDFPHFWYAETICDRGANWMKMILFKQTNITQDAYYEVMTRNDITFIRLSVVYWILLAAFPSIPSSASSFSVGRPCHSRNKYIIFTYQFPFPKIFKLMSNIPLQIDKTTLPCYHRFHSIRKINCTLSFLSVHWREIPHIADYSPARHHHI